MLRLKASHGTAQDRLALNLDRDPDRDRDRKINDLVQEWNMDAQDGQDLEWANHRVQIENSEIWK